MSTTQRLSSALALGGASATALAIARDPLTHVIVVAILAPLAKEIWPPFKAWLRSLLGRGLAFQRKHVPAALEPKVEAVEAELLADLAPVAKKWGRKAVAAGAAQLAALEASRAAIVPPAPSSGAADVTRKIGPAVVVLGLLALGAPALHGCTAAQGQHVAVSFDKARSLVRTVCQYFGEADSVVPDHYGVASPDAGAPAASGGEAPPAPPAPQTPESAGSLRALDAAMDAGQ